MTTTTLPYPGDFERERNKAWIEENIWGHRFRNDQEPWMVLLEALNLCRYVAEKDPDDLFGDTGPRADDPRHEKIAFELPLEMELRYLLFQDNHVLTIRDSRTHATDDAKWKAWLATAAENHLTDPDKQQNPFDYLRGQFASFQAFADTVELARSMQIEAERNRRWTSLHLTPHGPDTLLPDVRPLRSGSRPDYDRRFFSRGGELVYFMLNRSRQADTLRPLVHERLLDPDNRWNQLVRLLKPATDTPAEKVGGQTGYLPPAHHPAYDRLAEDWQALLSLENLPDDHLLDPLMRLTGLGALLYILERAADELGETKPPPFPLEFLAAGANSWRKCAVEHARLHQEMTPRALAHFITRTIEASPEWPGDANVPDASRRASEVLANKFVWQPKTGGKTGTPEAQLDEMMSWADKNHRARLGHVVGIFAQQIGLGITRRGVAGRWYSASDPLLEALVLANVTTPLEYGLFLERLFERYHFVVDARVAERAFDEPPVPVELLERNDRMLEQRLQALGLLKRLSDDCAFVENPFFSGDGR